MNEWQPIATAPKDGTKIDLWFPRGGENGRFTNCFWKGDTWWYGFDSPDEQYECFTTNGKAQPTHWMPLPEPPK